MKRIVIFEKIFDVFTLTIKMILVHNNFENLFLLYNIFEARRRVGGMSVHGEADAIRFSIISEERRQGDFVVILGYAAPS